MAIITTLALVDLGTKDLALWTINGPAPRDVDAHSGRVALHALCRTGAQRSMRPWVGLSVLVHTTQVPPYLIRLGTLGALLMFLTLLAAIPTSSPIAYLRAIIRCFRTGLLLLTAATFGNLGEMAWRGGATDWIALSLPSSLWPVLSIQPILAFHASSGVCVVPMFFTNIADGFALVAQVLLGLGLVLALFRPRLYANFFCARHDPIAPPTA